MKNYLKSFKMKLTTIGPVFIGSGKELSKKEQIVLSKNNDKLGVVDIMKLYSFAKAQGLQSNFEKFLLNYRQYLEDWLEYNKISLEKIRPFIKYTLDSSDTELQSKDGKKAQIMEFTKDPYDIPYVPGSSIKGMLRTILLATDIIKNPNKFANEKKNLTSNIQIKDKRNKYLQRDIRNIETKSFHTLNRQDSKREDVVNDILSGFIISDSIPISIDNFVLCQKIERNTDGVEKKLNLLRECIIPGTEIEFNITIDESLCNITMEHLMESINIFNRNYYDMFLNSFAGIDRPLSGSVYLGGGSGFLSKTIIYSIFDKRDGISNTVNIFRNTGVPKEHKHDKDKQFGASPHIVKCTKYKGKTLQMGLCKLECVGQYK